MPKAKLRQDNIRSLEYVGTAHGKLFAAVLGSERNVSHWCQLSLIVGDRIKGTG